MATRMVHINDLEKKIEAIINFTESEDTLRDCESWLSTVDIMRGLGLMYLTLEDVDGDGLRFDIH